jgi:hypothetical protein
VAGDSAGAATWTGGEEVVGEVTPGTSLNTGSFFGAAHKSGNTAKQATPVNKAQVARRQAGALELRVCSPG